MSIKNEQQVNTATQTTYPQKSQQILYTVDQFALAQPAFTAASLRNLIFKADSRQSSKGEIKGNGLIECGAIIRIGRKVLIHSEKFLEWVQQNGGK